VKEALSIWSRPRVYRSAMTLLTPLHQWKIIFLFHSSYYTPYTVGHNSRPL